MQLGDNKILAIKSDFRVIISPSTLCIPDNIMKAIDAIWQQAVEQPGSKLFDGKILCASAVDSTALSCAVMPYRFFYAQRQSNLIREALQIQIVAVSGVILHDQLLYFGRRSLSNTQYPGFIELVPSGSIDADLVVANGIADFRQQLTEELKEELGINCSSVSSIDPLFLIFDHQEQTWDICCQITLLPNVAIGAGNGRRSDEYEEIFSVPLSASANFVKDNSNHLVLTTQAILQQLFPQ